jgi:hypothetical protein
VLRLQISGTFQEANTGTRGVMIFDDAPIKSFTQEAAISRSLALKNLTHLVLWGKAYRFADGVAVQAYLTSTPLRTRDPSRQRRELWSMKVGKDVDAVQLSVDLPRQTYGFSTVVLSPGLVDRYDQVLGKLDIYKDRTFTQKIGTVDNAFRAYQYQPDGVELQSGGVRGWVPLPMIWAENSEIGDFTGAYFRILRGDWQGAAALLRPLRQRANMPADIRIDTLLLLGLAQEKRGQSGVKLFEEAMALNDLEAGSARYLIMGRLSAAQRATAGSPERAAQLDKLKADVASFGFLFPADDQWIGDVQRAAKVLSD